MEVFHNQHTLAIEDGLKALKVPTLIVWGTDDVYFDLACRVGWRQTFRARRVGLSSMVRGFSSPKSAGRSSTRNCARTGSPTHRYPRRTNNEQK